MNTRSTTTLGHAQHGLSLVELMVGIAVGLFVVAAATTLMANQLTDTRKLLVETQIQQDLRAGMDIITRQLRRAGGVDMSTGQAGLATPTGAGGARVPESFANLTPAAAPSGGVQFAYERNAGDFGPYGFKLEATAIESLTGLIWNELTDKNVMKVTGFTVTPVLVASTKLPCPNPCADGTAACWPELVVRDYSVTISAEARNDATVRRSMSSKVRLRNDWVRFNGPGALSPVCPV